MLLSSLLVLVQFAAAPLPPDTTVTCEVVVAGGTTAGLAAALHAAREGAETCLVEPTDWVGGQLTSEGVSAVDFAWHRVDTLNVAALHRAAANQPREWWGFFQALGNPGRCWVSISCFEPRALLEAHLLPAIADAPGLHVFYQAVPVAVERRGARLHELRVVQRTPRGGGYERPLSQALSDWYDPRPSAHFEKRTLALRARVFIDATPFGDLLVLSGAPFLQGTDSADGAARTAAERCGQAMVFPFVLAWESEATPAPQRALLSDTAGMSLSEFGWERVWTYRRLRASGTAPAPGDLSMQNWEPGNDYFGGYVLLGMEAARAQARRGWRGGVDTAALAGAERRALAWAQWFGARAPAAARGKLRLAPEVLGTANGLSKLPYLRDTRRSIGLEDYVLPGSDLAAFPGRGTGVAHSDRIALGAYAFDFRLLPGCPRVPEAAQRTLPYFLPFRALTNRDVANLLVAGRTMAQSHVANGATRLQPVEWNSGIAAGVAAAAMARTGATTAQLRRGIAEVQQRIRRYMPLEWTIGGRSVPAPVEHRPGEANLRPAAPAGRSG